MNFMYPSVLYFLGLLAIPIIIHFFYFRKYKKVAFSDTSMLKYVQEQRKSRRNIKHWLLLLLRLLTIALIVTAFARPYVPLSDQAVRAKDMVHAFYLDNSFSMKAKGKKGQLLEAVKKEVYDLSATLNPTAEVFLITNDMNPERMKVQDIRSFQDQLAKIEISPASKKFSQIVAASKDIIFQREQKKHARLYSFTDFQTSQFDIDQINGTDSLEHYFVQERSEKKSNVYLDSLWIDDPVIKKGKPVDIHFSVVNESEQPLQEIPVYLSADKNPKGVSSISIGANSSVDGKIVFVPKKSGFLALRLNIDDPEITFDNKFYGILPVRQNVSVLIVNDETSSNALSKLYQLDNYYEVNEVNIGQFNADLSVQDLVLFNEVKNIPAGMRRQVEDYVANGGSVALIPSPDANLKSYNAQLSALNGPQVNGWRNLKMPLEQIDFDLDFFDDIFEQREAITMPQVKKYIATSRQSTGFMQNLLRLKNAAPFLSYLKYGDGQVYWQSTSFDPEMTNWAQHALFSAVYLRIAERSKEQLPFYYILQKDATIEITNDLKNTKNTRLKIVQDKQELMTAGVQNVNGKNSIRIGVDNYSSLSSDGIYDIKNQGNLIQRIAFNYNRRESKMQFLDNNALQKQAKQSNMNLIRSIDSANNQVSAINTKSDQEYWRILLILSIVCLIAEIVINKLWKTT